MNAQVKYPLIVMAVFLWIGFVCAISFMEAWLKFRAHGVTLPIGLSIGRLVFNALNKIEWVFALAVILNYLFLKQYEWNYNQIAFITPLIILIIQTIWLLPALDARAELHIQGKEVLPSNIHFYYVATEIIKVVSLIIFGINLFK
jgi:hypothetical protein